MKTPPVPENEKQRLEALRTLEILDTIPERAYDNITKLASQICGTPIALVSLIDENRQWFKSKVGLNADETSRDISFCGHAIVHDAPIFQIINAAQDGRFADNPLVVGDPKIAFYAGAKLVTSHGYSIGTLCVIDQTPKELTPVQMDSLRMLADQVMLIIEAQKAERISRDAKTEAENFRTKLVSSLTAIPFAVSIFEGPELRYTFVNEAHTKYFAGRKNILGKSIYEAVPEVGDQGIIALLKKVYETGQPFEEEARKVDLKQGDGSIKNFFLNIKFRPLRLANGDIFGVISTTEDVTAAIEDKKRFQEFHDRTAKAETMLVQAVSLAKLGFYDWDIKADSIDMSEQFKSDWGLVDGAKLSDAFDKILPEDRKDTLALIEESIKNRTPYHTEYRIRRKGGQVHWLQVQGSVQVGENGNPSRFFGTSVDITFRKEIELKLATEKSQLDQILEKSPAAMATWIGEDLVFGRVNPDYQKIFPGRQLVGKPLLEACPELKGQGFDTLIRDVMRTGVPFVGQEVLAKIAPRPGAEPEDHYYNFSYIPLYNDEGKAFGVYDHAIDVTSNVIARKDLEVARTAAEAASVAKSQFLANMSHEIRTPLGAIMGFSDLLRIPDLSHDETTEYVDVIERNSKHLLRIIDDILDLSKVEAGMMTLESIEFSLSQLLSDFSSHMGFKAQEKGINFDLKFDSEIPETIISDPTRIRQILNNMVSNAIKFTEKGRVQLSVAYKNNNLELQVSDTGIGISAEQAEGLFTAFKQGDSSTSRKFGGTGLGLVLTRKLSESMGGSFNLEKSRPGVGSTFKASIQIQVPADCKMLNDARTTLASKERIKSERPDLLLDGAKILLIEDSRDNQVIISQSLIRQGAKVDIANNGLEGVDMALTNDFDVVVCDLQMPFKDGYDTLKDLRSKGYNTPIIALTAHAMKEEQEKALSAGFSEYLTKPIQKVELINTIRKIILS